MAHCNLLPAHFSSGFSVPAGCYLSLNKTRRNLQLIQGQTILREKNSSSSLNAKGTLKVAHLSHAPNDSLLFVSALKILLISGIRNPHASTEDVLLMGFRQPQLTSRQRASRSLICNGLLHRRQAGPPCYARPMGPGRCSQVHTKKECILQNGDINPRVLCP